MRYLFLRLIPLTHKFCGGAKSFKDYEGFLRRYVRPQLGMKPLVSVQAFDGQSLYRALMDREREATVMTSRCAWRAGVRLLQRTAAALRVIGGC